MSLKGIFASIAKRTQLNKGGDDVVRAKLYQGG
jgi:hypothetical protein